MTINIFRLRSSYYLAVLLFILHGGALACLWILVWPWWTKLLLALACLMSFIVLFCQHVLLSNARSVVEFWQQNGFWQVRDNLAEIKTVKLAGNSICTRYFVLLNFYCRKKRHSRISVLVLPDSLTPQEFRRLRRQLQSIN